jgi:hypothetical protein
MIRAEALPPQTCRHRACAIRTYPRATDATRPHSRAFLVPDVQSIVRLRSAWWSVRAATSRRPCLAVNPAADTETATIAITPEATRAIEARRPATVRAYADSTPDTGQGSFRNTGPALRPLARAVTDRRAMPYKEMT